MSVDNPKNIKIIHLWCGPRSLSTITMYSFAQRSDTIVYDEPLYNCHLYQNQHIYRPYRNELLDLNKDYNLPNDKLHYILKECMETYQNTEEKKNIFFLKHLGTIILFTICSLYHV